MSGTNFASGDWVVYTKQKVSASPGKRAQDITPAEKGDTYSYVVDKYWVVADVPPNGKLLLRTRRGKEHTVDVNDPMLRKPRWWERLFYASKFRPARHEN